MLQMCFQQINKIVEPGSSLRVVVESGGCSGFQYKFEMTSDVSNDDRSVNENSFGFLVSIVI